MHLIRVVGLLVTVVFAVMPKVSAETSVKAIALFNERAMLSIDGQNAKIIRAGTTYDGVKLVSSNTSEAVVEVNGQTETLTLNGTVTLSSSLAAVSPKLHSTTVEIRVNNLGFFQLSGAINGQRLEFLIDTGANLVVLSSDAADRVGLKYRGGVKSQAATASGKAPMYSVSLDKIRLGGIELENVAAGVIIGRYPEIPLLGMTFLRKMNMSRVGDTMTLTKR